jgi:cathepsin B
MASNAPSSPTTRSATPDMDLAQRRAAPLSTHQTTSSPIETPKPLHTLSMAVSTSAHSHSPSPVAAEAGQRFFPTMAVRVAEPQPTETAAHAYDNATATISPVSPAAPQPAAGRRRADAARSATASFLPPPAFDARDIYEGQVPCKAYEVLNQGGCGACYAFASATAFSARLCSLGPSASVSNVVLSPQSLLNCAEGCNGGDPLSTLASLVTRPAVEHWCDPYAGAPQACGSACGTGNAYAALAGSVRRVGGAGAYGVQQMQLALVWGGAGVASLMVMSDLLAYSSGVYSPSASALPVGGHAVVLVGWGVDRGVPYWLCQNSWGAGWGDRGFFRIVRGADACGIESSSGLVVARPLVKPLCPASDCSYFAATRRACTCQCPFGRTGPTCRTCALQCRNGGARVAFCSRCECRMGSWGRECEGGYRLSSSPPAPTTPPPKSPPPTPSPPPCPPPRRPPSSASTAWARPAPSTPSPPPVSAPRYTPRTTRPSTAGCARPPGRSCSRGPRRRGSTRSSSCPGAPGTPSASKGAARPAPPAPPTRAV